MSKPVALKSHSSQEQSFTSFHFTIFHVWSDITLLHCIMNAAYDRTNNSLWANVANFKG